MSISGARPAIWSASTRADPHDSAQPLEPWPRFSHSPGMPLAPMTGGPSGSMGRAPFHTCTPLDRRAAAGNQSASTL